MSASFNSNEDGGLPAIVPAEDPNLLPGTSVVTSEPQFVPRHKRIEFPGLSGAGLMYFGMDLAEITWTLVLAAESLARLQTFEALFKRYKEGGAYPLVSEAGALFDYVALVRYEPGKLSPLVGMAGGLVREATVRWLWTQPS